MLDLAKSTVTLKLRFLNVKKTPSLVLVYEEHKLCFTFSG